MRRPPQNPFRATLRQATQEEIGQQNYDAAEVVLKCIRQLEDRATDDLIRGWLSHPDERVVLAVLELMPDRLRSLPLRHDLLRIYYNLIAREPGVWNLIIDRCARILVQEMPDHWKAMEKWLRQASSSEVIVAITPMQSEVPVWAAAKECRLWTPDLVSFLLARSVRAAALMGRNRYLVDADSVAHFLNSLLNACQSEDRRLKHGLDVGLRNLLARSVPLPDDAIPRMLALIKVSKPDIAGVVAAGIGRMPCLDDELAMRVLDARGNRWEVAAALIEGKRCSLAVAKRALQLSPRLPVRRAIAKRPELLLDPEIRAELKKSDCARVRRALVGTAKPEEAGELIERLVETNLSRAVEVMSE